MEISSLNLKFINFAHNVRDTVEQSVPAEALPKVLWLGLGLLAGGLVVGVFGALIARGAISIVLGGAGLVFGAKLATQFGVPHIAGGLLGFAALASVGFFAHKMWVGLGVATLTSAIGLFAYGHDTYWPEFVHYDPQVTASAATVSFEIPSDTGAQQARRNPVAYLQGFYNDLKARNPALTNKASVVALVCAVAGFCWGLWFTRGALIICCATAGTMLLGASLAALAEAVVGQGWEARLANHPQMTMAFIICSFLLSNLVQYRFTQPDKLLEGPGEPKTKPAAGASKGEAPRPRRM
jgi:hypothetical protein